MPPTAEERARETIDAGLAAAGWTVQDRAAIDLSRARGVAVRELRLAAGHGVADYLLFVDGRAVGVLEAMPAGHTLTGAEPQARRYAGGLPRGLHPPVEPLPFLYLSSGEVTRFTNLLDPRPRSRRVFAIHRPETLAGWLDAEPLVTWSRAWAGAVAEGDGGGLDEATARPSTPRGRLRTMPKLATAGLFANQARALEGLDRSLRESQPRAEVVQ